MSRGRRAPNMVTPSEDVSREAAMRIQDTRLSPSIQMPYAPRTTSAPPTPGPQDAVTLSAAATPAPSRPLGLALLAGAVLGCGLLAGSAMAAPPPAAASMSTAAQLQDG